MFYTTTDHLPDHTKVQGIAIGVAIHETSATSQFMSNLKDKLGGADTGYEKTLLIAAKRAINNMMADAENDGAHGIINVRINDNIVVKDKSNVMVVVTAYGSEIIHTETKDT